jgi:hypothetical protein
MGAHIPPAIMELVELGGAQQLCQRRSVGVRAHIHCSRGERSMPKGARTRWLLVATLPPPATDSTHAARIAQAGISNSNWLPSRPGEQRRERHQPASFFP